jgi:hypothetical protein
VKVTYLPYSVVIGHRYINLSVSSPASRLELIKTQLQLQLEFLHYPFPVSPIYLLFIVVIFLRYKVLLVLENPIFFTT